MRVRVWKGGALSLYPEASPAAREEEASDDGRRCGVVASEDEGGGGVWTEAWSHCRRSRRSQGGTRRRLRTPERGSTGVTTPGSAAEGTGRLAN